MNRLRVRLSLAFIGVIILVLMTPFIISSAASLLGFSTFDERSNIFSSIEPEHFDLLMQEVERIVWRQFLLYVGGTAVIGSIAGLLVSRSLTEPLRRLAEAATDIGQGNLSRRVEETGTDEVRDVAHAFNNMANDLEHAEDLRQNLLADVAHELRTPLTVLQGNLRAILDDVYPLEKEEISRVYDQTRLLTRLIDDLRTLAQADARQLTLNVVDVDVAKLVKSTANDFRPLADQIGIELRVELLGVIPALRGDRDRLAQSLQNLINNAIQHTPPGGQITVQTEQVGDQVALRVIDTGHGIAPEQIPYVFERFYRTDGARSRETGGTGLGLAITEALVEAHNGHIKAESEGLGRGSAFTILLPTS